MWQGHRKMIAAIYCFYGACKSSLHELLYRIPACFDAFDIRDTLDSF